MNRLHLCLGLLAALAAGCAPGTRPAPPAVTASAPPAEKASAPAAATAGAQGDLYYFDHCPECDRLLGARGDPVVTVRDGRHLRFCQQACATKFAADAPGSTARLDRQMIADQAPLYPVDHSIVSGRPLGPAPEEFIWGNRLIRVCDAPDRSQFLADPARFMAALDQATVEARWKGYPVIKCPVQGTRLEEEFNPRLAVVVAQRIIRVCCLDCAARVREQPSHYLPLINLANRQAGIGRGKAE